MKDLFSTLCSQIKVLSFSSTNSGFSFQAFTSSFAPSLLSMKIKYFFFVLFLLASFHLKATKFEFTIPQNAFEAELNAHELEKLFFKTAEAHHISNPQGNAALLFLYTGDSVPENIRWIASVLSAKGIWVKFEKDNSNEEGLELVESLEKSQTEWLDPLIAQFIEKEPELNKYQSFRENVRYAIKVSNAELKKFFGLRQGLRFYFIQKPFADHLTGFRQPLGRMLHDLAWQAPLVVFSTFSALYSVMKNIMPISPEFFNWTHYQLFFALREQILVSGNHLALDPLYFALAAATVRTFWGVFDRAADAELKLGKKFNPYKNRLETPYAWQVASQFMLSFVGDLYILIFGHVTSMIYSGQALTGPHGVVEMLGEIPHVMLNSLTGAFAKKLPKSIIFHYVRKGTLTQKGQAISNAVFGYFYSVLKIANLLHAGWIADLAYYSLGFSGLTYEAYRLLDNYRISKEAPSIASALRKKWIESKEISLKKHKKTSCHVLLSNFSHNP